MLHNTAAEQRWHVNDGTAAMDGWRVVSPGERPQPSVAIVTPQRSFLELTPDSREGLRSRTSASQPSVGPVCTSPPSPTGGGLSSLLRLPLRSPLPICLSALRLPSWGGTRSLPPPSRHLPLSCAVIDMDAEGEAEGEGGDLSVKSGGGK